MEILFYILLAVLFLVVGFVLGRLSPRKPIFDGKLNILQKDSSKIVGVEIDIEPEEMDRRAVICFEVRHL